MTENNSGIINLMTQFVKWLKNQNGWIAVVVKVLLALLAAFLVAMTLMSCGVSRASVNNRAAGTTTSITITNENESSPNVSVKAVIRGLKQYKSKDKQNETETNAKESQ